MSLEFQQRVVPALMRDTDLYRHSTHQFANQRGFAVTTAHSLPRLWQFSTQAAARALDSAFEPSPPSETTKHAPMNPAHTPINPAQVETAMQQAQQTFANHCGTLIERQTPDCRLVALWIEGSLMHTVRVGSGRVYLKRGNERPQRLTPREDSLGGLLEGAPFHSTTPIEPDDIILLGSSTAFSQQSVDDVGKVLSQDAQPDLGLLARLLTRPTIQNTLGGAAITLRILDRPTHQG